VLPSTVRIVGPYVFSVWVYVPESNWNMPRPPCSSAHGPSAEPAMIGSPPHDDDAGPLHAYVASDQQCARFVSETAMPPNSAAL
jgi:hypothetical protein